MNKADNRSILADAYQCTHSNTSTQATLSTYNSDKSKLRSRCRYLVVSTDGDWLNISKFTGTQLRATSYRVKRTECYKVLSETGHDLPVSYEYDDATDTTALPEAPPDVPVQLTYPPPTAELPQREPYEAETATPAVSSESSRTVRVFFFGVYSWLVKVLGQFSIIYFRGSGLRIGVRVWVRVGVRVWVRVRVRVRVRFRVRVRIRVRVGFGLGL